MQAYTYPKTRVIKPEKFNRLKDVYEKKTEEPPVAEMFVQGKKATAPEWRIAQVLDRRGTKYIFQYAIKGGRVPGGAEIDFFVYTAPLPTPILVNGDYWHRLVKSYHDAMQQSKISSVLGDNANEMLVIWEHEIPTINDARRELNLKLGGW
jgi:hypothetical protein